MKTIEKLLPNGLRWRELWLAELLNNSATIPSSAAGGQKATVTGGKNGTTTNGVRFFGTGTSNAVIAAAAGNNAQAAIHITIRFKLTRTFTAGAAADMYLFNKAAGANNFIRIRLESTDGKLYWEQGDGAGGNQFQLTSTTTSWTAGTWYTVTCSLTDAPAQRLLVNGAAQDTDTQAAVATPNGGDLVFASSSDGGTDGIVGTISYICIGTGATATVALAADDEADLAQGAPPATAKVQYLFPCDEGVGATLVDRGSAAGNATLDTACTWEYGTCKQAVLSLEGINDYAAGAAGSLIIPPVTMAMVIKAKCTYNSVARDMVLMRPRIDADNELMLYYRTASDALRFYAAGNAASATIDYSTKFVIGNYYIILMPVTAAGVLSAYVNGASAGSDAAGVGAITASAATVYLGSDSSGANVDVHGGLMYGLIDGALTAAQAKHFSRNLDQFLNLGIGV